MHSYLVSTVVEAYKNCGINIPHDVTFYKSKEPKDVIDLAGDGGGDSESGGDDGFSWSFCQGPRPVKGSSRSTAIASAVAQPRPVKESSRSTASASAVAQEAAARMLPPKQFTEEAYRLFRSAKRGRRSSKSRHASAGELGGPRRRKRQKATMKTTATIMGGLRGEFDSGTVVASAAALAAFELMGNGAGSSDR
jgi:hypothetical protein